jgi:hypothetical protein
LFTVAPPGPPLCINEAQLDVGLKLFDESAAMVD